MIGFRYVIVVEEDFFFATVWCTCKKKNNLVPKEPTVETLLMKQEPFSGTWRDSTAGSSV